LFDAEKLKLSMDKKIVKFVMLSSGLTVAVPVIQAVVTPKPNILILTADDLGWNDISSAIGTDNRGSKNHQTPNIDQFFAQSKVFTRAYTQQNSAPTRAALLTGQYAIRSGVFNVGSLDRGDGDTNSTMIIPPVQNNSIDVATLTFAETLQTVGYKNYIYGKVHGWNGDLHLDHGFDYDFSTSKQVKRDGQSLSNYLAFNYKGTWIFDDPDYDKYALPYTQEYINKHLKPFANGNNPDMLAGKPKHLTDAIGDCVIDNIASADKSSPFCMWVCFHAIHSAIVSRDDLYEKYLTRTTLDARHTNYKYAALTEQLDQTVARILAALDDPNGDGDKSDSMADNTVVIFSSDNGGVGGAHLNTPLRGEKGMFHEGGTRVPLAVRYPGKITAGTVSQVPVHVIDYYPTLAEIAGASLPDPVQHVLDGESFAPILFDEEERLRRNFIRWHFPGYLDTRLAPTSTVTGTIGEKVYKLHYYYEQQRYELYCLTDDEVESNNLLALPTPEIQQIVEILRNDMVTWLETNPYKMHYRNTGTEVELPVGTVSTENKISFSNNLVDLGYVSVNAGFDNNNMLLWVDGATALPTFSVTGSEAFDVQLPQDISMSELSAGVPLPFHFAGTAPGSYQTTITVNCGANSKTAILKAVVSEFGESFSKSAAESGTITHDELNDLYAVNEGWEGHSLTIGPPLKAGEYARLSAAIGSFGASNLTSPEISMNEPFHLQFRGRMIKGGVDNAKRTFTVMIGNDTLYNHLLGPNNIYTTHAIRQLTYQSDRPFRISFSASSTNAGAETDGITVGEIQLNKSTTPTVNIGVAQNWDLGYIAPGQEKEYEFPLKGWHLNSGLTAQSSTTNSQITLLNNNFIPVEGKVNENLRIRIVAPLTMGKQIGSVTISGGGITLPVYRKLWMHYEVNPYQDVSELKTQLNIFSEGRSVIIKTDVPADILLTSLEGRVVSAAKSVLSHSCPLSSGIYLISVNAKTCKYVHMIK
jgi:arylsulfatase A-like enzyme